MSEETGLDATGIVVELFDLDRALGSPRWVLPLGGGRAVRDERLSIEVHPLVEMPRDRWRDYHKILRLAAEVENRGGYMRSGDTISIGDETLVGRDLIELLVELARRANERAGSIGAEYRQGYRDALRDMHNASGDALDTLMDRARAAEVDHQQAE